jgi:hypothetical protein
MIVRAELHRNILLYHYIFFSYDITTADFFSPKL